MLTSLVDIVKIIALNLILSGDNAVVIGLAANRLSDHNRRRAIIIGGGGAVVLRVIFTLIVQQLLRVPLLGAVGGILLIWIAYRLADQQDDDTHVESADTLGQAVRTIIIADTIMSLDNMLAVGAVAEKDRWLLVFGLAMSIPVVLFGSELVSRLLRRLPILTWAGIAILVYTAIHMTLTDPKVKNALGHPAEALIWALAAIATAAIWFLTQRRQTNHPPLAS
jgi:YjbE family integral membrane protein